MEDDRCNNCYRLGACIIPFPEKEGVLFTKACLACGYEEECNGLGGPLAIKDKSTQTEFSVTSYFKHFEPNGKEGNQKKYEFGKRRQQEPAVDVDDSEDEW